MDFPQYIRMLKNKNIAVKLQRQNKSLRSLESKRKKLTDMLLDDKITKEAYQLEDAENSQLCVWICKTTHVEMICLLSRQPKCHPAKEVVISKALEHFCLKEYI